MKNDLYKKLEQVLKEKSNNKYYLDNDIQKWYEGVELNQPKNIETELHTLTKITTEQEMLDEGAIKLPLIEALEYVIELVEKGDVTNSSIIIFIEELNKYGTACVLFLWRYSDGRLELDVSEVFPDRGWHAGRRVLRKKS